jgi:hypothetical protein
VVVNILGTDSREIATGEDQYVAAYRIWAMHPSNSSGMEGDEEGEDEGAEEDEGADAEPGEASE